MGRVLVPKLRTIHSGDSKFHGGPIAGRLFHCGVNGGQDSELEARVDCAAHSPSLPSGHPFADVQDIYWSSTTSLFESDWAWLGAVPGKRRNGHRPKAVRTIFGMGRGNGRLNDALAKDEKR